MQVIFNEHLTKISRAYQFCNSRYGNATQWNNSHQVANDWNKETSEISEQPEILHYEETLRQMVRN